MLRSGRLVAMTKTSEHQILTNAEVSALIGKSPATTRSNIHREEKGESTPAYPKPIRKVGGSWVWDRLTVEDFIARNKPS